MQGGFPVKWYVKLSSLLGRIRTAVALCIMYNIPVVVSVCSHSCSSAELLNKVLRTVLFFPSYHCVKRTYGTAITSEPAGNSGLYIQLK